MSYTLQHTTPHVISETPVAHYDFTSLTTTIGSAVSAVNDISGNSYHLSAATPGLYPMMVDNAQALRESKGILFTNNAVLQSGGLPDVTTGDTLYLYCVYTPLNTNSALVGVSDAIGSNYCFGQWVNYNDDQGECINYAYSKNSTYGASTTYTTMSAINFVETVGTNSSTIVSNAIDMQTDSLILSGAGSPVNAFTYPDWNKIHVGNTYNRYGNGVMYEVMYFNKPLTDADRQKIRDYVQEKYDIQRKSIVGTHALDLEMGQHVEYPLYTKDQGPVINGNLDPRDNQYTQPYVVDLWFQLKAGAMDRTRVGWKYHGLPNYGFIHTLQYRDLGHIGQRTYVEMNYNMPRVQVYLGASQHDNRAMYVTPNRWHHIRFAYDQVARKYRKWFDGKLQPTNRTESFLNSYAQVKNPISVLFGMPEEFDSDLRLYNANPDRAYVHGQQTPPMRVAGYMFRYIDHQDLDWENDIPLKDLKLNDMPVNTPGGGRVVSRDDQGMRPLNEQLKTPDMLDRFPLVHGKHKQSRAVFGNNLDYGYVKIPDLHDIDIPYLYNAVPNTHLKFNRTNLRNPARVLKNFKPENLDTSTGYHLYLDYNLINDVRELKDSSFAKNSKFNYVRLDYTPLTSVDGLQSINDVQRTYLDYTYLTNMDPLCGVEWPSWSYHYATYCHGLSTVPEDMFVNSRPHYCYHNNNKNLTTIPRLSGTDFKQQDKFVYYYEAINCAIQPGQTDNLMEPRLHRIQIGNQNTHLEYANRPKLELNFLSQVPDLNYLSMYNFAADWNNAPNMSSDTGKDTVNLDNNPDLEKLDFLARDPNDTNNPETTFYNITSRAHLVRRLSIRNCALSGSYMQQLGASGKRIVVTDGFNLSDNPELEDLRVFIGSQSHPGRNGIQTSTGYAYLHLDSTNISNTANSIGALKDVYYPVQVYMRYNHNLTGMSHMFPSNYTHPDGWTRADYKSRKTFKEFRLDQCKNMSEIDWLLQPNAAGIENAYLDYTAVDYPELLAVKNTLLALKAAGDINLKNIYMTGSKYDVRFWGGGTWYLTHTTHNATINNEWVHHFRSNNTSMADTPDYTFCTDAAGTGSTLSPQAQLWKDFYDGGITIVMSSPNTTYNPHSPYRPSSHKTCPNWYQDLD